MKNEPNLMENTLIAGEGTLADGDEWLAFLSRLARLGTLKSNPDAIEEALVARNFALDEGVLEERAESYSGTSGVGDLGTIGKWSQRHEKYLRERVALPADDDGPPDRLDPGFPEEIPETFRYIDPQSPFLGTDDGVLLVRVEELDFIADKLGEDPTTIRHLLERFLSGGKSRQPRDEQLVNELLYKWHESLDQRPVYAGFWQDLKDLEDAEDWSHALRDRLGLLHLEPRQRQTKDIVVFRYPVKDVPRILGTGGKRRPLVTPTVLDSRFSAAFCPSPRGSTTGHVVNLQPETDKLRREALHPRLCYRASHLWRLGTISKETDPRELPDLRALHLLFLRDEAGREDYAKGTDRDLYQ